MMKKVVLKFGLISGAIIAVLVWVIAALCDRDIISFDRAEIVGYASMLIALSMIFFGIKSYRDNYAGGKVTFWKGIQVGLWISLIAGFFYFASAMLHNIVNPDFDDKFAAKYKQSIVEKMTAQGATLDDIDKATAEVDHTIEMLQNPLIYFAVSMIEILPVCMIVTLTSAGLLRRKELLPASA